MTSDTKAGEALESLGFSDYEARAYLALLGEADRNGYEVAKASGIPRANVYPVLERLVARHAARRIETRRGRRYAGVAPEGLLARLRREHRRSLDAARSAFADLAPAPRDAPVFNLRGRNELLAQTRELLAAARTELLLAVQPREAGVLAEEFAEVRDRGVAITTLCMAACERECGACAGDIHRYGFGPDGARWLLAVADGTRMIAGETRAGRTRAIATGQPLIVELAGAWIRQSLALATMAGALGERFNGLLSEQARELLDGLHPEGGFLAWLQRAAGPEAA